MNRGGTINALIDNSWFVDGYGYGAGLNFQTVVIILCAETGEPLPTEIISTILNNHFLNGIVTLNGPVHITIDNCTFKNNYSHLSGGIQLFNSNITFMGDVTFANYSGFSAGAIYMSGSYLRFTSSLNLTFIGKSANFVGGEITVKESFNL